MRRFAKYIDGMYRPSFVVLSLGLALISLSLVIISVIMREQLLIGDISVIYHYPVLIEEIIFRGILLIAVAFAIDHNERRKNRG